MASRLLGTVLVALLLTATAEAGAHEDDDGPETTGGPGKIIVANRGSGNISIIDVGTDTVTGTVALPPAANKPEPMYVVHVPKAYEVLQSTSYKPRAESPG
jgi:YVTN family beta-propeller protein